MSDVNGLVERLLMFLESGYDHIVAETLIQLRDLLRRYPDLGEVRHQPASQSASQAVSLCLRIDVCLTHSTVTVTQSVCRVKGSGMSAGTGGPGGTSFAVKGQM